MEVAILTVGDEILAGDTENTNASWVARQVTARGATVARILTVPDDAALITETVREWHDAFDAVVVMGGLGGTHDDVTMAAVADAFDRELVVEDAVAADVEATARAYRENNPEQFETYEDDLHIDVEAWASTPEGAEPLLNEVGLSPGCVVESVYVFPGPPAELKAMFETVADRFGGDLVSQTFYTPAPEGAMGEVFAGLHDRFDVVVGSYAARGSTPNRVKLNARDEATLADAVAWLRDNADVADDPDALQ
ncbi:molybdenum cofactor synthesis domain-containing protein [Halogranum gelatinilyticum]|uniref:Molybdenum cofactor synthesis domain-containing protein n=1 Tax=Halogranum gelatinilyticum TaxID=660521 RepID=A0A1G9ZBW5_9EURY|nr:molybdopterin-binding protein [Halogranum gelatinilyticum]SDN18940.1 molybdenum cofactor synthesis domain-containing protein [Halogranum gelatinilyticum]